LTGIAWAAEGVSGFETGAAGMFAEAPAQSPDVCETTSGLAPLPRLVMRTSRVQTLPPDIVETME